MTEAIARKWLCDVKVFIHQYRDVIGPELPAQIADILGLIHGPHPWTYDKTEADDE